MMGSQLSPIFILVVLVSLCLFLAPLVFYIRTLQSVLNKCASNARTLSPGKLWLIFVPLFGLIWHFFVVLGVAKSLGNELRRRNVQIADPAPGQTVGIAMCIFGIVGPFIPHSSIFNIIASLLTNLAGLVLWIMYWVKISGYSRRLGNVRDPEAVAQEDALLAKAVAATVTVDDYQEWLKYLAMPNRPPRKPGQTVQDEYKQWILARARSRIAPPQRHQ
jgi:hypothetical protein